MKTINTLLISLSLAFTSAANAGGASTKVLIKECKTTAVSEFSAEDSPARARFKGIQGSNQHKQVKLQVFEKGKSPFNATCHINPQTREILQIERTS